jgi:hypothetical protein
MTEGGVSIMTKNIRPHHGEEFCTIHGQEHMVEEFGNPIQYCEKCEEEERERVIFGRDAMMAIPVRLAWALVSTNVGIRETAQIELRDLLI